MSERSLRFCSWWTLGLGVTVWHYCVRVHGKNLVEVHWTLRDTREGRHSCVPVSVTAQQVRCPRGVSLLHAPEIFSKSSSCGGLRTDRG